MVLFFEAMRDVDGAGGELRAVDAASFRRDGEGCGVCDGVDALALVDRAGATDGRFVLIPNVL
jgi:hypothetical protein